MHGVVRAGIAYVKPLYGVSAFRGRNGGEPVLLQQSPVGGGNDPAARITPLLSRDIRERQIGFLNTGFPLQDSRGGFGNAFVPRDKPAGKAPVSVIRILTALDHQNRQMIYRKLPVVFFFFFPDSEGGDVRCE